MQSGVLLVTPVFLVLSMYAVFQWLRAALEFPLGYFIAFGVYWLGWLR